jgi:hypothetical protein
MNCGSHAACTQDAGGAGKVGLNRHVLILWLKYIHSVRGTAILLLFVPAQGGERRYTMYLPFCTLGAAAALS